MANAVYPTIDFHPRPVNHSPSPFGFGFGLSNSSPMVAAWPSTVTPGHMHSAAFHQLGSSINQASSLRVLKRRHEPDDDDTETSKLVARDDAMDRSPTPERSKKAPLKRARIVPIGGVSKDGKTGKGNKPSSNDEDDVDVGVLLASLPPQSLLPLLASLLNAQPSLKSTILSLIPRPTLETALQALALSAKKLRDAYPYSNSPSFPQPVNTFAGSAAEFGRSLPSFGQSSSTHNANNGGMRDSYILSRLRPHITEFVAACMSYLPYFSYISSPSLRIPSTSNANPPPSQTHSHVIQSQHKDKSHPSETFVFLSALTDHLFSQPPLAQSLLAPLLLPRLSEEWKAWVDRVDEVVNRQSGMFGSETVRIWEKELDKFANSKESEGRQIMREVRNMWVAKVGWLVGRMGHHAMEEEL